MQAISERVAHQQNSPPYPFYQKSPPQHEANKFREKTLRYLAVGNSRQMINELGKARSRVRVGFQAHADSEARMEEVHLSQLYQ